MITFKDFLLEAVDTEDLSAEELKAKAREMMKRAQLKSSGREDQANKQAIRDLQQQLRDAKEATQRADIQRRIKELMDKEKQAQSGV